MSGMHTKCMEEMARLRRQNEMLLMEQAHEENVRKQLQERAERAESACAEMRSVIEDFKPMCVEDAEDMQRIEHAISTDCGKGVLERIEKLREMLVRHHNYRIEMNTCNGLAYSGSLRSTTEQALEETK